ncbi:glutamate--cysteine ligase [Streptomyces buecherae]|uniref:glutamate--cysteine ligase n=1 Tax=Streptomyces buecherae TaxID=2763006 RepID=UPI003799C4C4
MGREVGQLAFAEADYALFRDRLRQQLHTLADLTRHASFGAQPPTLGAELEMPLAGDHGRPVPLNMAVRDALLDERLTLEVTRHNLEANLTPVALAGCPFTELAREAAWMLTRVTALARANHGARAVSIGTLPTLTPADLTGEMLTPAPRYHALERAWARRVPNPFPLRVRGRELLRARPVTVQGAVCSWQVHLTVPPDRFNRTFNAAQLATGPALAAAGNSPLPLGHHGWQESRITWYEQGFGDRQPGRSRRAPRPRVGFGRAWLRGSRIAAFEEAVHRYDVLLPDTTGGDDRADGERCPPLEELRLHLSTVWPWNRPVYDPTGHLRIEFRALPSGPTPLDMAANTAFLIGLTLSLTSGGHDVATALPFAYARANFYRAARDGLRSSLWWPSPTSGAPREHGAADLVRQLLPRARAGLLSAGVRAAEADTSLELLRHRVTTGHTGARWQERALEALEGPATPTHPGRPERRTAALRELTTRYARLAERQAPVHTWPLPPHS